MVSLPGPLKYETRIVNHYTAFAERSTKDVIMNFQSHHTTEINPEPHTYQTPSPLQKVQKYSMTQAQMVSDNI